MKRNPFTGPYISIMWLLCVVLETLDKPERIYIKFSVLYKRILVVVAMTLNSYDKNYT